jgi:S1-C subfamily serine protease
LSERFMSTRRKRKLILTLAVLAGVAAPVASASAQQRPPLTSMQRGCLLTHMGAAMLQSRSPYLAEGIGAGLGAAAAAYNYCINKYPAIVSKPAPAPAERPQQPQGVGRDRYGTGFYVTAEEHLVTNHHVAGACRNVQTSDGTNLKLIGSDKSADLALLQAIGKTPRASASFRQTDAKIGEPIIVFGFPLPGILSTSGNLTTGAVSATSGIRNDPRNIQISAPVQPGNSGGPLLDQYGNIIGVVVTKLDAGKIAEAIGDIPQNVNFAIKGSEVVAFLARHKITSNAGSTVRLSTEGVAAAALSFTVQIICHAQ